MVEAARSRLKEAALREDFANERQAKNDEIEQERRQLAQKEAEWARREQDFHGQNWTSPEIKIDETTSFHRIFISQLDNQESQENNHWNFAAHQVQRLTTGGERLNVVQVDVYNNTMLKQRFNLQKDNFVTNLGAAAQTAVWVFHGTPDDARINAIMKDGFKVGGVDPGVPVLNGAVHGHGVYTASGPDTPMQYGLQGLGKKILLCKALEGKIGTTSDDSWKPKGDWVIFKSGAQLYPIYVIHIQ
jgi:hypothetical protein